MTSPILYYNQRHLPCTIINFDVYNFYMVTDLSSFVICISLHCHMTSGPFHKNLMTKIKISKPCKISYNRDIYVFSKILFTILSKV